ncbi:CHAD domain-containing protein (plasmid) [Agrobacterium tumefaciens]|uniref:CHAD domain-containing protein n=1 Tax=Agrobacterium deltaense Zutra 3/1 TaxID=1183427 RepID=A0A1S7S2R8_9HYPH|nr:MULTISPECIES: CHAD domain-containing protein [Agrobacterium]UXT23991.1 CHAD domain-containing protein [Agrobacterium tumefaciens]CUX61173.1 hypothetical protein AGR7C_pAt0018 [Agrobacterium deltaense Zutra 3/1]
MLNCRSTSCARRWKSGVDDEHWHEARKDAKKLRYAAECFRVLFPDKRGARRYKRSVGTMEVLQDELGALNDLATGPEGLGEARSE